VSHHLDLRRDLLPGSSKGAGAANLTGSGAGFTTGFGAGAGAGASAALPLIRSPNLLMVFT
tara:strand:- start:1542 stop:1724 length:183 start_codon:yes stop_codon:yes gene_type:complete